MAFLWDTLTSTSSCSGADLNVSGGAGHSDLDSDGPSKEERESVFVVRSILCHDATHRVHWL